MPDNLLRDLAWHVANRHYLVTFRIFRNVLEVTWISYIWTLELWQHLVMFLTRTNMHVQRKRRNTLVVVMLMESRNSLAL